MRTGYGFAALSVAWMLALAQAQAFTGKATQRPNIVIVVADDLGWADVGYHNPEIKTPHIDRLVRHGVELHAHYVQPQCTPTRVALMTGRYPSRFGNHCTQASNQQALPFGTPTLASALRDAGYETAICGKWHLGSKPEWGPNHYGFDHSYGSLAGAVGMYDHRYRLTRPEFTQTWHRNHEFVDEEGHATDLVTREAVQWIERERSGPFFLYVPYQSVHVPLVEEQRWLDENAHIEDADRRLFAAAVTHMDDCIGRMVEALARSEQLEDTLIVFTSDNGGLHNHRGDVYPPPDPELHNFSSNLPLRGQKSQTYEGGMRVPAFAHWKDTLAPRRVDAPLHVVDWMPTLLDLVDAPLITSPDQQAPDWDGTDIWPLLRGDHSHAEPRTLYWIWGEKRTRAALRHGDWKIVRMSPDGPFELYNLAEDPNETTDLADDNTDQLADLVARFEQQSARDAR